MVHYLPISSVHAPACATAAAQYMRCVLDLMQVSEGIFKGVFC